MMIIVVAIFHVYFLGLTVLHGQMNKLGIGEAPEAYRSQIVMGILGLSILPWIILTGVLLLLNWKIALGLFVGEFIFGFIIFPLTRSIFELTLIKPLYMWVEKREKQEGKAGQ